MKNLLKSTFIYNLTHFYELPLCTFCCLLQRYSQALSLSECQHWETSQWYNVVLDARLLLCPRCTLFRPHNGSLLCKASLVIFLVGAQKTGLLDIKNVMFLIVDNYAINRTNLDDWFRIWPWDKTSFTEGKGMEPNTCLTSHHRSDWEGTLKETCIYNGANIFFWDVSDEVKAVLKEENIQSGSQTLLYRFYDFGQRRILKGTLKQVNKWGWERVWECFSWGAGLREGGVQLLDDIRLSSSVVFHQSIDSSFNLPFFSPNKICLYPITPVYKPTDF